MTQAYPNKLGTNWVQKNKDSNQIADLITLLKFGGERGIRTLGGLAPTTVFETVPFNHSGTSPAGTIAALARTMW